MIRHGAPGFGPRGPGRTEARPPRGAGRAGLVPRTGLRDRPYALGLTIQWIAILRGLASSSLGTVTVSTPSANLASTFSASTFLGSAKERANAP